MYLYGDDLLEVKAPLLTDVGALYLTFVKDLNMEFPALTEIRGNLYVYDGATGISAAADFSALTTVVGQLSLTLDATAINFPALLEADSINVTDAGYDDMNASFPALDTLNSGIFYYIGKVSAPKLTSAGSLYFGNGVNTADLRSLKSLTSNLTIYNTDMTDLGDFSALQLVDGTIEINSNYSLSDVTELNNVLKVDYLYFTYNRPVTDSDGAALARALNLGSNTYIYGNGP
jgi:hypothetical protein